MADIARKLAIEILAPTQHCVFAAARSGDIRLIVGGVAERKLDGVRVWFKSSRQRDRPAACDHSADATYQLFLQVRRVMSTGTARGTGGAITALWS